MTKFRCINDFWGYCSDKPTTGKGKVVFLDDGQQYVQLSCRLSPKTCGKYLTNTELAIMEGVSNPRRKKRR